MDFGRVDAQALRAGILELPLDLLRCEQQDVLPLMVPASAPPRAAEHPLPVRPPASARCPCPQDPGPSSAHSGCRALGVRVLNTHTVLWAERGVLTLR